jgi:predicted methyltransferase
MTMNRRLLLALLAASGLPADAQSPADAELRAALDSAQRSAANRARDGARHPLETLQFFGLQPGQTVIELMPGNGWYTEILAPLLRERGKLFTAHYARDDASAGRRKARENFEARLAANPAAFDRVGVGTMPTGPTFTDIAPTGGADLVLTFRNVHNWLEAGHLDASLRAFFAVLKPGGILGVVDHRAAAGTPLAEMKRSGYVTEALMTEHARAAGFDLSARSEINANPRDTRDHAKGVWALPPSLAGGDVDRDKFVAIGESDRFTHRYVKPRA